MNNWVGLGVPSISVICIFKRSGKKQTSKNFYKNNDTFEFGRHVSVVQRPSSVESRISLKLHLNLLYNAEQKISNKRAIN